MIKVDINLVCYGCCVSRHTNIYKLLKDAIGSTTHILYTKKSFASSQAVYPKQHRVLAAEVHREHLILEEVADAGRQHGIATSEVSILAKGLFANLLGEQTRTRHTAHT